MFEWAEYYTKELLHSSFKNVVTLVDDMIPFVFPWFSLFSAFLQSNIWLQYNIIL